VAAALLATSVGLQIAREHLDPLPLPESGGAMLYIRSPEAVRRVALSYDALAADLYWIRAIQHYGSTKRSTDPRKAFDQLYPLLDLATSLDPRFTTAYRFGAIFLSEPFPSGPGRADLAIALLEKGLQARPDYWGFAQDIGFVHYWWLHDYPKAAAWFVRASEIPGAPNWMKPLAAVTLAQGGNRSSSRQLWRQVDEGTDLEWLRVQARTRLRQLDALDQIDALLGMARDYEQRSGAPLRSWADLMRGGYVRGVPLDPAGHQYVLDVARGRITLSPESPLNPLPVEPVGLPGQLPVL
jgi:hypothetical protein